MNQYELKENVEKTGSYFFTRHTMKCFGDTMSNYGVRKAVINTYTENNVECYELYRKRPVKMGNQGSAYFDCQTFARRFPKNESEVK